MRLLKIQITHSNRFLGMLLLILASTWSYGQDTIKIHQEGLLQTHEGAQLSIFGSLELDNKLGDSSQSNKGVLYFTGSNMQTVTGDSSLQFDSIVINSYGVQLEQEMRVGKHLLFQDGNILTNRNDSLNAYVHFLQGSDYSGESDDSHVDGAVSKSGNTAFDFPIGNANNLQPLAISAPSASNDQFMAFYREQDASSFGYSTQQWDSNCGGSPLLVDISENEFWFLDRLNGSAAVEVTLYYDDASGVNTPTELLVTRWDGSEWESMGNGGVTGNSNDGTVVTGTGCGSPGSAGAISVFGPFTIGGTSNTAVPVELISFEVYRLEGNQALLEWVTASELNNNYFEIEHSLNGVDFTAIGVLNGAGTTFDIQHYSFVDATPSIGMNYYRVRQVDYNGDYSYTPIRTIEFSSLYGGIRAYPIPTSDFINIDLSAVKYTGGLIEIQLFSPLGELILNKEIMYSNKDYKMDLSHLPSGMYLLSVGQHNLKLIKQ
ncbi:MAG: T9SS type A sorting domain-containing protein [Bacteroidia bacterium]